MTSQQALRFAAGGVVVAALAGGAISLAAPSSHAATNPADQFAVLAGSAHFLVYADYPTTRSGVDYTDGALHVIARPGGSRNLGVGFADTNPEATDAARYSVISGELTEYSPTDPTRVRWWDLNDGTSGSSTLPVDATWQGSAPGGWVIVGADHTTVSVESNDGQTSSYGQPLSLEATALGQVQVVSGPNGILSVGTTTDTLAFQSWSDPTGTTSLDPALAAGATGLRCDSMSAEIAACQVPIAGSSLVQHIAVPLDGSAPLSYQGCSAAAVALDTRLVWTCPGHPAHPRFASGSSVTTSGVRVAAASAVNSVGGYVTPTADRTALVVVHGGHTAGTRLAQSPPPAARIDVKTLLAASKAVEAQALKSGALSAPVRSHSPAQILLAADDALILAAKTRHPSLHPADTRALMGRLPSHLRHRPRSHPAHHRVSVTHSLSPFSGALRDRGAGGFGTHRTHGGEWPAPYQKADHVYVDPTLSDPASPTVSMVALRTALGRLGQPYVWAAAGPRTFDCSGLVQWAYAHAGRWFSHFSGDQYNEARLIPARDILPGDLILFEHHVGRREVIHHVAIYVGAGWMLNAPFTSQYVNLVPVPAQVAGVVRP